MEIEPEETKTAPAQDEPVGDPFDGWPETSKPEAGPAPGMDGDVYGR